MIEKIRNAIETLKSNTLGSNRLMKSNLTPDFHRSHCMLSVSMLFFHLPWDDFRRRNGKGRTKASDSLLHKPRRTNTQQFTVEARLLYWKSKKIEIQLREHNGRLKQVKFMLKVGNRDKIRKIIMD